MAFSNAAKVWQLTMHFSGNKLGWQEKLFLDGADAAAVILKANNLLNYRLTIFPSIYEVVWAKVSQVGNPRDRRAVTVGFPLIGAWDGEPFVGPAVLDTQTLKSNRDSDAVMYGLETGDGAWTQRYIHGIPDKYYTADNLTQLINEAVVAPPAIGAGGFSTDWFVRFGYYLYLIQNNTLMFRKRFNGAQTLLQTDAIASCYVKKATSHKVGRVFGEERGRAVPR